MDNLRSTNQCLRDSREAVKNQWILKVKKIENLSQRDRANTYHARLESDKWFVKYEQVLELANLLLHTFPLRLRYAFKVMTPENTPSIIFDFIIFYRHMVKDLQEELARLMEVRSADSG